MRPLLLIMQPRQIDECVDSLRRLRIPKIWFRGFTERELEPVIANEIAIRRGYTHFVICCDDGLFTQHALDSVLRFADTYPVVTGYCNLDLAENMRYVNLRKGELPEHGNTDLTSMYLLHEVWGRELVPTSFAGFSLTCMTRDLWERFPFQAAGGGNGDSSDWLLSRRLVDSNIPIVAAGGGFHLHVKERWNTADRDPRKHLVHVKRGAREVELDL